jgi:hypothetical protein
MADIFVKDLDDLQYLSKKCSLVFHLKKNYVESIHYIVIKKTYKGLSFGRGGHNKIKYMMSEKAFELMKNSFNLRNRYIVNINDNINCVNSIGMCIENQTIGFIENSFKNILNVKRQFILGKYKIDLYFIDYKIAVECDENNHEDRDKVNEKKREEYILSLGNKLVRFNPNDKYFDLSNVLREINTILFEKQSTINNYLPT